MIEDIIILNLYRTTDSMYRPKYSIILVGQSLIEREWMVEDLLHNGIKVLWFGIEGDVNELKSRHAAFVNARLLQVFIYEGDIEMVIIDGMMSGLESSFEELSKEVPAFDSGQYQVEHCTVPIVVVKASAGTGKTSVMIDRIMFLLHTKGIALRDVVMITFTNDATSQMGRRLQESFIQRYLLTGNERYLVYLEEISQMTISTIDSFSLSVLRRYGVTVGFSGDVSVGSYAYETSNVIMNLLDRYHDNRGHVKSIFGATLYDTSRTVGQFYSRLRSKGVSTEQVENLDWGNADGDARSLQDVLVKVTSSIDREVEIRKIRKDSVPLSDLITETSKVIDADGGPEQGRFRYLFVDEFQDTNDSQIRFIATIASRVGADILVVGDPKQSIYRFRGADDSAFDSFTDLVEVMGFGPIGQFELVNNYRTDPDLLRWMDRLFRSWVAIDHLDDYRRLVASAEGKDGYPTVRDIRGTKDFGKILVTDLRQAMEDIKSRVESGEGSYRDKVAVLVRTNNQLDEVLSICDGNQIPRLSNRDEPFFLSKTVRDFYAMINSYVYESQPQYLFDFLVSPYASIDDSIDVNELFFLDGDRALTLDYLSDFIDSTRWTYFRTQFMNRPVLAVLRDMVSSEPVVDNYISDLKSHGITNEDVLELKGLRYRLNLDKLIAILFKRFSGGAVSLYEISEYLRIAMATDRNEMEVQIDPDDVRAAVICTTIHKAKGLEFDTVIIPYDWVLNDIEQSEILISTDWRRVGWKFYKRRGEQDVCLTNSNYGGIKAEDIQMTECEETRTLYVAMTRSVRRLFLYIYKPKTDAFSWARLLQGARP